MYIQKRQKKSRNFIHIKNASLEISHLRGDTKSRPADIQIKINTDIGQWEIFFFILDFFSYISYH
jgi:hypothetical protein